MNAAASRLGETPAQAIAPRVLHVVESLGRGAVENWLLRMLRHARRRDVKVDWTFYCTLGEAGCLAEEALALGANVVVSPVPIGRQGVFVHALREEMRRGQYDVLHCHHDLISGLYLVASLGLPMDRRIVHAHNADEEVLTPSRLKQAIYRPCMRGTCLVMADRLVGISGHTLDTLLAGKPPRRGRDAVHYYGIDPAPFVRLNPDRAQFRAQLALPESALILLFAGRIVPEKNPLFAVEVLSAMRKLDARVFGVFAGTGSLEQDVVKRAGELGVDDALCMLGWRDDLPDIMGPCDWFILPRPERPMEGFGLAVVEAQLAGLRLLLSEGIPDDPLLPTAQVLRLPLALGAAAWATAALGMLSAPPPQRDTAQAALAASPMDMDAALAGLMALHG